MKRRIEMIEMSPVGGVQLIETQLADATSSTVEKDEFLKLLITQLQNQDPLEPMNNAEFVSQVTQFSSLEQLISIREAVESTSDYLAGLQESQQ
jgi:flagellar basal-body rod modification protein FlgD